MSRWIASYLQASAHLAQAAPGGVYRIAFPDPAEGRGVGDVQPRDWKRRE
jgi:hypothetical protein